MSEQPTPEAIADEFGSDGRNTIHRLDHYGYVIVHPDDFATRHNDRAVPIPSDPYREYRSGSTNWINGYLAAMDHVLAVSDE